MNPTSIKPPNFQSFPDLWGHDSASAFLNHGSFGACPLAVLEYQRQIAAELERQPMAFLIRRAQPLLDQSREILCELVGADSSDVVFVQNATSGVNAVLRSLKFEAGDEILTTSHDYNACRNAANYVAQQWGAKVVEVPLPLPIDSPEQITDAVLARVTPCTRLVMLDHITSPTALIFPVEEIVRRLDERGIDVLIDGAHTPGMIPLDLRRLGAAYYTGNCHKWLCSPKGAGFLYVRPDRQEGVMPPVIGHGYNKPRPSYSRFQDLFDWPGTFDPSAWISVGYAIKFLSGLLEGGLPALMQRNHDLAIWARRMLLERLGRRTGFQPVNKRQVGNLSYDTVQPIGPESMLGSMAAMILPGDNDERHDCTTTPTPMHWLNGELWEKHRIETVVYNWPAAPQRVLRISAQVYNTPEQYERLADALRPYV